MSLEIELAGAGQGSRAGSAEHESSNRSPSAAKAAEHFKSRAFGTHSIQAYADGSLETEASLKTSEAGSGATAASMPLPSVRSGLASRGRHNQDVEYFEGSCCMSPTFVLLCRKTTPNIDS